MDAGIHIAPELPKRESSSDVDMKQDSEQEAKRRRVEEDDLGTSTLWELNVHPSDVMNVLPSATVGPINAAAPEETVDQAQAQDTFSLVEEGEEELDEGAESEVGDVNHVRQEDLVDRSDPVPESDAPGPSSPAKSLSQAPSSTARPISKPKSGTATKKKGAAAAPASTAKKPAKGKSKTKVEELKGGSKPRSNSVSDIQSSTPSTPARTVRETSLTTSPDKNAVYCVCRRPYADEEEDITMLGCESCDNWFHPGCIGLTDEMVELLDVYICKSCERNTAQRTIYKKVCKRDGCMRSVAGSISKFCCSSCAYQHSHSLVASMSNKKTLKQLAKTFIQYPPPSLGITVTQHGADPSTQGSKSLGSHSKATRLSSVQAQIEQVEIAVDLVKARQEILRQAIERCEALHPVANALDEEAEEVSKKSKKKKGSSGPKEDRPCGWVRRLIADDGEVQRWIVTTAARGTRQLDESPHEQDGTHGIEADEIGDQDYCLNGRKRCDRHQGWQKTMAVSLEVELAGLERTHRSLAGYQDASKAVSVSHEVSTAVKSEFQQRRQALK
ncbi:hypothetical protein IAU60_006536 [Kwoniella sp. DSM 27419]